MTVGRVGRVRAPLSQYQSLCHFVTSTDTFELLYILYTPDRELPWTHGDRYERLIASPILDVLNINATIWGRGQIKPHL